MKLIILRPLFSFSALPVHKLRTTAIATVSRQPRAVVIAVTHSVSQSTSHSVCQTLGPLHTCRAPFGRRKYRRLSSCRLGPVKLAAACNYGLNAMRTPLDRWGQVFRKLQSSPFPSLHGWKLLLAALECSTRSSSKFWAILYFRAKCCC